MRQHVLRTLPLTLAFFVASANATPSPEEIVQSSLDTLYSPGDDQSTTIQMELINSQGQSRKRQLTMLRKDVGSTGDQKYYIYFHSPTDVKGTAFLIHKLASSEDDRWLYIPAVKMIKRIAANDKRSSFVGSDFTYEDVSGRDINDEKHTLLREENINGRNTYVIESAPKTVIDYTKRISWVDAENWLPIKEEFYDVQNKLVREFSADKIEEIQGTWTITQRTMSNKLTGHRTTVHYEQVKYNNNLEDELFSERYLRNPPRQWVR
jgi:outer membrane lipoprotein-sorting protein